MPLTTAGKNQMLNNLGVTHVSLHTAAPGENGASEVSGGAYARVGVSWDAAAAGNLNMTSGVQINVPAGTTIVYVGFWTASTGGEFRGYVAITQETFASAGTYDLNDADIDLNAV